jgi:ribosomal protein S18 acetylase RimI-like enzyme
VKIAIRPLRADDLRRLFHDRSRPYGEQWIRRQGRSEVYVAVAELDGVPVGRVGLDFVRRAPEGAAHLWAAHVEPAYQSRGIGTELMTHLEEVARARGFNVIRLGVGKENVRARQLYERLGYRVCGEEKSSWTDPNGNEVVEDCWTMERLVAP